MPRHLDAALDQLQDLHNDGADPYQLVEDCPADLRAYFESTRGWHRAGLSVEISDRWLAARLWKLRPELRPLLSWLVQNTPCQEFSKVFARSIEQGHSAGDVYCWLAAYPGLKNTLRPAVERRARCWWKTWPSIEASLLWARRFDGGDEAWHQAACTIYQNDLKRSRLEEWGESFLRHDLETHGTITPWEGAQINRFLLRYDTQQLKVMSPGMWWMSSPPTFSIPDSERASWLAVAVRSSSTFAGEAWSAADDALYAESLRRLAPHSRQSFLRFEQGGEVFPVQTRIMARVAQGSASDTSMRRGASAVFS